MSRDDARAVLRRTAKKGVQRLPALRRLTDGARAARRATQNLAAWSATSPSDLRGEVALALDLATPPIRPRLEPGRRTTIRAESPGTPSAVLCSMATGPHIDLLSISAPTLIEYGERHGWDVVLSTEAHLAEGRPASWGKVRLLQQLLDEYDLVWWVDADALIVDTSDDLRAEVRHDKDLYLVEHMFQLGFAASCGVMLWKSTDWSREFLADLWGMEEHATTYPWENGAMLDQLGYASTPFFHHAQPTSRMERTALLSSDWNSVAPDPGPRPRVNHHGGDITTEQRKRLMLEDLRRFLRGLPGEMPGPARGDAAVPPSQRTMLTDCRPASTMTRNDLGALLNERGLTGDAAEVGVFAAEFSARLLKTWRGRNLVSIDPWISADDYLDVSNVNQSDFELLHATSCARLDRFGDRSTIWRLTSEEAAAKIPDATLDFVYIDARHDEESVAEDVALWFPKVRAGGILAGHDYLDGDIPEGVFGVKSAVSKFFGSRSIPVHVTGEEKFPSWIVEIPALG